MLTILISGAGISGLTAAIALRRAGHRVTLLERSRMANELGAAIHIPPNASRALLAWGFDPLRSKAVRTRRLRRFDGVTLQPLDRDGADLSRVEEQYGAPWYLLHRVDLHNELRRLAEGDEGSGLPVEVRTGCEVVGYNAEAPSLTLANGTVMHADIVIAADGVHSMAVEAVLGQPNRAMPSSKMDNANFCYRFLIHAAEIEADPETRFWNHNSDGLNRFLVGEGKRIVSYPCRNNEQHNFVAIFHHENPSMSKEDWQATLPKAELLSRFSDFHPSIVAILKKANEPSQHPLLYRPPIPSYHRQRIALVGDAAHPMLPHQGQGGAQAIQDGVCLGILLSDTVKSPDVIMSRLELYDRIRRPRASAVTIFSNAGQDEAHKVREEVSKYLGDETMPQSPSEFHDYNFSYDVIQDSIQWMRKEVDPDFELRDGFFQCNAWGLAQP